MIKDPSDVRQYIFSLSQLYKQHVGESLLPGQLTRIGYIVILSQSYYVLLYWYSSLLMIEIDLLYSPVLSVPVQWIICII